ncbi:hypothetical protein GCM10027269_50890 [Kribbella endophytica]
MRATPTGGLDGDPADRATSSPRAKRRGRGAPAPPLTPFPHHSDSRRDTGLPRAKRRGRCGAAPRSPALPTTD